MRGTQLLERSIEVILSFLPDNKPLTIAEISSKVDFSRPTVHRIIMVLEKHKFLIRSNADKRFQLGPMFIYLGNVAKEGFALGRWARPTMERLAETSGETIHLSVRVSLNTAAFIEKVESSQSVRLHTKVGEPVPLYTGATLKVILAHLPEEDWEAIIEDNLVQMTQRTITDPETLKEHLRQIRRQGYAVSREELFDGAGAVAAPILTSDRQVIAGLGISGPAFRLTDERIKMFIPMVTEAAQEIGRYIS